MIEMARTKIDLKTLRATHFLIRLSSAPVSATYGELLKAENRWEFVGKWGSKFVVKRPVLTHFGAKAV